MTRRDFVGAAAMAAGGALVPKLAGARSFASAPFSWGCLLHLGSNMWDDFDADPDGWSKSEAEEKVRPNPIGPSGRRRSRYHSYLKCHDDLWRKSVDHAAADGLNLVFIDLGEDMAFPSHPELAVPGTWSVEKMRKELARMRMGFDMSTKCRHCGSSSHGLSFCTAEGAHAKEKGERA